jgi:L-threonylcarbamoyladenylate synthase
MLNKLGWRTNHLVSLVRKGGVIAYPTEGVWGLGCLPESLTAVTRILGLKNRSWEQGLILVGSSIEQFHPYLVGLSPDALDELHREWPGPVTYLLPDNGYCPLWIKGKHNTVALRVSEHPVVKGLCARLSSPIVSTSANPSGRVPARNSLQVRKYFPSGIDFIVPGNLGGYRGASEVKNLITGSIIREATP